MGQKMDIFTFAFCLRSTHAALETRRWSLKHQAHTRGRKIKKKTINKFEIPSFHQFRFECMNEANKHMMMVIIVRSLFLHVNYIKYFSRSAAIHKVTHKHNTENKRWCQCEASRSRNVKNLFLYRIISIARRTLILLSFWAWHRVQPLKMFIRT